MITGYIDPLTQARDRMLSHLRGEVTIWRFDPGERPKPGVVRFWVHLVKGLAVYVEVPAFGGAIKVIPQVS